MLETQREYNIEEELEPLAKTDKTKYVFSYEDYVVYWDTHNILNDALQKYYSDKNESKFIETFNRYLEEFDYWGFTICKANFEERGANCKFISEPMTIEYFLSECYYSYVGNGLDNILTDITIEKIVE